MSHPARTSNRQSTRSPTPSPSHPIPHRPSPFRAICHSTFRPPTLAPFHDFILAHFAPISHLQKPSIRASLASLACLMPASCSPVALRSASYASPISGTFTTRPAVDLLALSLTLLLACTLPRPAAYSFPPDFSTGRQRRLSCPASRELDVWDHLGRRLLAGA